MTVVSGCPMERSIAEASARLILWLEADYGWDRWRAYDEWPLMQRQVCWAHTIRTQSLNCGQLL